MSYRRRRKKKVDLRHDIPFKEKAAIKKTRRKRKSAKIGLNRGYPRSWYLKIMEEKANEPKTPKDQFEKFKYKKELYSAHKEKVTLQKKLSISRNKITRTGKDIRQGRRWMYIECHGEYAEVTIKLRYGRTESFLKWKTLFKVIIGEDEGCTEYEVRRRYNFMQGCVVYNKETKRWEPETDFRWATERS